MADNNPAPGWYKDPTSPTDGQLLGRVHVDQLGQPGRADHHDPDR